MLVVLIMGGFPEAEFEHLQSEHSYIDIAEHSLHQLHELLVAAQLGGLGGQGPELLQLQVGELHSNY